MVTKSKYFSIEFPLQGIVKFMTCDYYYHTRIYNDVFPLIEARYATVTGKKNSSNFGPGQYNKFNLIHF